MTTMLPHPVLQALVGDEEVGAFFSNEAELSAMLRVEAALAEAEATVGLIDGEAARRIAETCRSFQADWEKLAEGLARDGVIVPEFVKQLRAAVGEPHAKSVHFGATSQDVIDTALVLRLKAVVEILGHRLDALIHALNGLKRPGRLCAPDGAYPNAAGASLHGGRQDRHLDPAAGAAPGGAGVSRTAPARGAARRPRRNPWRAEGAWRCGRRCHGREPRPRALPHPGIRSAIASASSAAFLSLLSGTLGKIGQDIALMAQNEVGEVRLATGGGSSAMPHKSNPVPAEVLVTLARFNAGLLGTLHQALVHENERSGAAWTLEWMVLPQMVVSSAAALSKAQALAASLNFTR